MSKSLRCAYAASLVSAVIANELLDARPHKTLRGDANEAATSSLPGHQKQLQKGKHQHEEKKQHVVAHDHKQQNHKQKQHVHKQQAHKHKKGKKEPNKEHVEVDVDGPTAHVSTSGSSSPLENVEVTVNGQNMNEVSEPAPAPLNVDIDPEINVKFDPTFAPQINQQSDPTTDPAPTTGDTGSVYLPETKMKINEGKKSHQKVRAQKSFDTRPKKPSGPKMSAEVAEDEQFWKVFDLSYRNEMWLSGGNFTFEGRAFSYDDITNNILSQYKSRGVGLAQFNHQGAPQDALDKLVKLMDAKWGSESKYEDVTIQTHGSLWGPAGAFKARAVFDAPPEYVAMQIQDFGRRPEYDHAMKVGLVSKEDAPFGRFVYAKMHSPFSERDFHAQCFLTRNPDPDTGEIVLTIPCRQADEADVKELDRIVHHRGVNQDGVVRAVYKAGGWIVRPRGEHQSVVSYLGSVDPMGWIPTPLVNAVMARSGQLLKPFKDYTETQYKGFLKSQFSGYSESDKNGFDWRAELRNAKISIPGL